MARGWVVVEGERIVSVTQHEAARCRARDRHRRRDPAGSDRPARPSGVQRVRRVGAAEDLHQPGPVARQHRVRRAGQEAVARLHQWGEVEVGEDRDDSLRRGAGGGRRCDRDPGSLQALPEEGRGAGPQRRPASSSVRRSRGAPSTSTADDRRRPRASARASSTPGRSRRTTSTSPRVRRRTRRRSTSSTNFAESPLFGPATVMIHGTALTRKHFDQLAPSAASWCGHRSRTCASTTETTDIEAALAAGVPIALGADWMPSGSPSLLHELKIAERVLAEQAAKVPPKRPRPHGDRGRRRDRRTR